MTLLSANAYAWDSYDDFNRNLGESEFGTPVHIAGGAIAAGLTMYLLPQDWKPVTKWIVGLGAGFAAGCLSEAFDKNWDNNDLLHWGFGGVLGATLFTITF